MPNTSHSSTDTLAADRVEAWLREHPDFLLERPDLLAALNISHDTPAGIPSLIERQVARLRGDNTGLQQELRASNQELAGLQELVLQTLNSSSIILDCNSVEVLSNTLWNFIHEHYQADSINLSLFLNRHISLGNSPIRILGRNDKLRILLIELFNRQHPLFDSLQHEHLQLLFDEAAGNIRSTALLPLSGSDWDGLLALGSCHRNQYQRGIKFDLLKYLAQTCAGRLDQWLHSKTG